MQHVDALGVRRDVQESKRTAELHPDLDHSGANGPHRSPMERCRPSLDVPELDAKRSTRLGGKRSNVRSRRAEELNTFRGVWDYICFCIFAQVDSAAEGVAANEDGRATNTRSWMTGDPNPSPAPWHKTHAGQPRYRVRFSDSHPARGRTCRALPPSSVPLS